jgi:hypothetical protein
MTSWSDVVQEVPEFAQAVQALFDAGRHKTMATLRRDGSPRISGTEASFKDGEVWLGSMWQARKALDLQRDPRLALHSASADPSVWKGDAKLAGHAVEITDPAGLARFREGSEEEMPPDPFHLFRIDITEAVLIGLGGDPPDHIVIQTWRPGRGVTRVERR